MKQDEPCVRTWKARIRMFSGKKKIAEMLSFLLLSSRVPKCKSYSYLAAKKK